MFRDVSLCMTKSPVKEMIRDLFLKSTLVCLRARCHCLSELRKESVYSSIRIQYEAVRKDRRRN